MVTEELINPELKLQLAVAREYIEKEPDFLPRSSESEIGPFLIQLAKMIKARTILEIGTFKGYTTCSLIETGAKVTSIDIHDQRHSTVKELADKGLFTFKEIDSHSFLKNCKDTQQGFDLIYVDGDHDEHYVKKELLYINHILKHNTICAIHDAFSENCPGVMKALEVYREQYNVDFIVLPTSRGCGLAIL